MSAETTRPPAAFEHPDEEVLADVCDRLATTLASDARTQPIPPGYRVQSAFGRVLVVGVFDTEARLAVGQVCSSVPGVRSVQIRSLSSLPARLGEPVTAHNER